MLASGAADRNREIVTVLSAVFRQPFSDECINIVDHFFDVRKLLQILNDWLIFACVGTELFFPVRIRKTTDIKNQIAC